MDKLEVLKRYFGYTSFRTGQNELIDAALSGRDALGIMPTGGGKSLCYQVPALMFPGITVVISPLISLMKDQVMALKEAGVRAAYINSTLTFKQLLKVYDNLRAGLYKIVYVAPERLLTDGFLQVAMQLPIAMVTVDEAHCISQWGNDFRPSYLSIIDFIDSLPVRPVVSAFTATATEQVRADIIEKLSLRSPLKVVTGFDRPNLRFEVINAQNKRSDVLLKLILSQKDKCGIVYCMTRKRVEAVCDFLIKNGIKATRYHAGLELEERQKNQEDFVHDRKTVIVATNAFGMGIDKSNVSYVIHFNMPLSLEAYYQEAGRAGRDGSEALCTLLYSPSDIMTANTLLEHSEENDQISEDDRERQAALDRRRLERMIEYCKTTKCLRRTILEYFGQNSDGDCDNCSNCSATFDKKDITLDAQKIISCIIRIRDLLGYYVGSALVVRVLREGHDQRIQALGLTSLSTYGIMKNASRGEVNDMIAALCDQGYLRQDRIHGSVEPMEKARRVLSGKDSVYMEYKVEEKKSKKKSSVTGNNTLFEKLRTLRQTIAAEQGVPAYIVFSNATLEEMAKLRPVHTWELMEVPGVGRKKADLYGERFMKVIKEYEQNDLQDC